MHLDLRLAFLSAALLAACAPEEGLSSVTDDSTSTTNTTQAPSTGEPTTAAPATTTTGETTGDTTGEATEPTTGDAPTSTTGDPAGYCWGFDDDAAAPFLELYDSMGNELGEGVTLPLECGGQGSWMFGLYPKFGGWDPMEDSVVFTMVVDVEGHNVGPTGHFFDQEVGYYVGCEDLIGGVFGVVPIIPPDEIADLAPLDGLDAVVHVEISAGGETLAFDATMPLSAPMALTEQGCMFGP